MFTSQSSQIQLTTSHLNISSIQTAVELHWDSLLLGAGLVFSKSDFQKKFLPIWLFKTVGVTTDFWKVLPSSTLPVNSETTVPPFCLSKSHVKVTTPKKLEKSAQTALKRTPGSLPLLHLGLCSYIFSTCRTLMFIAAQPFRKRTEYNGRFLQRFSESMMQDICLEKQ